MSEYLEFLAGKAQAGSDEGIQSARIPDYLFDFQADLTEWAIRKGRAAIFADCGLGKTGMELAWADAFVRAKNRPAIILTPLAVAHQTLREAEKFGIEARVSRNGDIKPGINIINYERLHLVDGVNIVAVAGDESSILKSFDGARRGQVTEFVRRIPYRLLSTATPSPNEYTELGTHSEALGYLGYMDMLSRFFKNDHGNSIKPAVFRHNKGKSFQQLDDGAKWRLKGHAAASFWRWVCSWARAVRKPSDIGFSDGAFTLPLLQERSHLVTSRAKPDGMLFALPAVGLAEQRAERRRTIEDRCTFAATLVAHKEPAAIWCQLNDEGDMLEELIPDCVQVSGDDENEEKEEKFLSFISGQSRVLVTKPRIGAWGLNFQHCAHSVSFATHSFEEYYQSIRRFWRFGQKRPVISDIVTTEGEKMILENLQRKASAAEQMFAELVTHMHDGLSIERASASADEVEMPQWL